MGNIFFSHYKQGKRVILNILGIKIKFKLKSEKLLRLIPHKDLPMFEVHIAEHCNLNCQCCTHFSPLAEPEFLPLDDYEKDMKRMSELTTGKINVGSVHILGGEPLLNKNCTKYLELARKYFPNSVIRLITNGILLPQQPEEFWKVLSVNNITLAPTKYPIDINWKKIQDYCNQYKIKLDFYLVLGGVILLKQLINFLWI